MFNKKKNNKGFTLVELLVVIAIIGILAVVALPSLFKNIEKSKVADLTADINAIRAASLAYYTDENKYPTASGNIKSDINTIFGGNLENISDPFKATYALAGVAGADLTLTITLPENAKLSPKAKAQIGESLGDLAKVESDQSIKVTLIKAPTIN